MNKIIVYIVFCSLLVWACVNKEKNDAKITIRLKDVLLNYKSKDTLTIHDVALISLETTEESLLSFIVKIEIGEKYLYVNDIYKGGSLAIFDKSGRFVQRIPQGNGPEEISDLGCFSYDKYRDRLLVYQYGSMKSFSAGGRYICNYDLPFFVTDFIALTDGYLLVQSELHNENQELNIIKTDTIFNITDRLTIDAPFSFGMINHLAYDENGAIIIPHPFDNNIYTYNDNAIAIKQCINLDNFQFDMSSMDGGYNSLNEALAKANKYVFSGMLLETDNYEYIKLDGGIGGRNILINKKTKSCYDAHLPQLPLNITTSVSGNYFVGYVESDMILFKDTEDKNKYYNGLTALSLEQKSILLNSSPEDNPIIILYSIE